MDLQEKTRMQDTHREIDLIIDKISALSVGLPLVWVYVWDVVKDMWTDFMDGSEGLEYCTQMDLDEVWELLWTQADKNAFTLEYGTEALYESIRDWMFDQEIVGESEEIEDNE